MSWARIPVVAVPTLQPPWPWILRKLVNLGKYFWVATPPFPPHSQVPLAPMSDRLLTGVAFIGPVSLHFFVINVESFTGSSSTLLGL